MPAEAAGPDSEGAIGRGGKPAGRTAADFSLSRDREGASVLDNCGCTELDFWNVDDEDEDDEDDEDEDEEAGG